MEFLNGKRGGQGVHQQMAVNRKKRKLKAAQPIAGINWNASRAGIIWVSTMTDTNESDSDDPKGKDGQQRPSKKQKLIAEITCNSKPYDKIEPQIEQLMKKIVDQKIFPWSKYLMSAQEVEGGFVQMAMVELGWKEHKAKFIIKRSRSWHSLVEYIIKRCADRRHAAVAAIKKACKGK